MTPRPGLQAKSLLSPPGAATYRRRARRRARHRDALDTSIVVSVAAAVALFLSEGGLSRFGSFAGTLTALGIICGLAAFDLVCVMLLLAARVPLIDRTIGHDRALQRHRSLGKPVLYLLLAHGLLLTLGYAAADGISAAAQTAALWTSFSDMRWAYLGLTLFSVVAVSSFMAVKRRYPHEVWHAIHGLTYAAVAVSLPHQFTLGLFSEPGYQRWYWLGLVTLTAASVLVYRFLVPILQTLRHKLRVAEVRVEKPGVASITMTGRRLDELNAGAGQFFNWRFLDRGLWWQSHPYSLSAAVRDNRLRITVRNLGRGSERLLRLRPGTPVAFEGPYGIFTEAARTGPRVIMVASGIGISPIRALLEESTFRPGDATVLLRASSPRDIVLAREIEQLCLLRGANLHYLTGRRHPFLDSWLPADLAEDGHGLRSYVSSAQDTDLYICGPRDWTTLVEAEAQDMGFPADAVHSERFAL